MTDSETGVVCLHPFLLIQLKFNQITHSSLLFSLPPSLPQAFEHAQAIKKRLNMAGFRVEVDPGSERLGKQIRNAEQARIPVMGIIGAKVRLFSWVVLFCGYGGGDVCTIRVWVSSVSEAV